MKRSITFLTAMILAIWSAVYISVAEETGTTTGGSLIANLPKDCTYGPDTCIQGFVWREATANDTVCVRPNVREQTQIDNSQAVARRSPIGESRGPNTCLQGYVWREAFPGDAVCVTPQTRSQAALDNRQANARKACR